MEEHNISVVFSTGEISITYEATIGEDYNEPDYSEPDTVHLTSPKHRELKREVEANTDLWEAVGEQLFWGGPKQKWGFYPLPDGDELLVQRDEKACIGTQAAGWLFRPLSCQ